MEIFKVLSPKKGKIRLAGLSLQVNNFKVRTKDDNEANQIRNSPEYAQKFIVPVSEKEIDLDSASQILAEKLGEISFYLAIDEIMRLKNLPEPGKSEVVKLLRENFFQVLEHFESTGISEPETEPETEKINENEKEVKEGEKTKMPNLPDMTKKELAEFLTQHNIPFDPKANKDTLLELALSKL